jgi:signal peptidase I
MIIMVIFGFYTVPSGSMEPTLHVGDTFIGVRRVAGLPSLHRGDVIVFKDDAGWMNGEPSQGERLVKRLIGLPGDTVSSTDGLNLYVNGHLIHEPQIKTSADGRIVFNVKVTSGHLFVLGDNRGNSSDSRYHLTEHHGLIRESSVEAILLLRIRPVTNITTVKGLHDVYEQ